jgi:hypothetical protein
MSPISFTSRPWPGTYIWRNVPTWTAIRFAFDRLLAAALHPDDAVALIEAVGSGSA